MPSLRKARWLLEWIAMELAVRLVPLLSRGGAHRLGGWLGALVAAAHRSGRAVALENLEVAFGDRFSPAERRRLARESYQNFARAMIHLLWSARVDRQNFSENFEVVNLEEALAGIDRSRGLITVTFHFGDWEAAALAMGLAGYPLLIVAQESKNPYLGAVFTRIRERAGHQVTGRERAIMKMFKALKGGRTVAILSDLAPKTTEPFVAVDCFGLKTCVTFAHAWLHQHTGAAIVPLFCEQLPDGRRRLVVLPPLAPAPEATVEEIAQACWDRFEAAVRNDPGSWLWMYKHWRYKPTQTAARYPSYAGEWRKLDRQLAQGGDPARPLQHKRRRLAGERSG